MIPTHTGKNPQGSTVSPVPSVDASASSSSSPTPPLPPTIRVIPPVALIEAAASSQPVSEATEEATGVTTPRRKVRFADGIGHSPSSSRASSRAPSAADLTPPVLLEYSSNSNNKGEPSSSESSLVAAGFAAPEVLESENELSIRSSPGDDSISSQDLLSIEDHSAKTLPPPALATVSSAAVSKAPPSSKPVRSVKENADSALSTTQQQKAMQLQWNVDKHASDAAFLSPAEAAQLVDTNPTIAATHFSHRSPSPLLPSSSSASSTIVAFSSRLKGSSVLFAPPKHKRSSEESKSASLPQSLISPIDFNHHNLHNNLNYAGASTASPAASPNAIVASTPERLRANSNSQQQPVTSPQFDLTVPPAAGANIAVLPTPLTTTSTSPAPLPPISSLPANLPSRDLSSLRSDVGVGHSYRAPRDFDRDFRLNLGGHLEEDSLDAQVEADERKRKMSAERSARHERALNDVSVEFSGTPVLDVDDLAQYDPTMRSRYQHGFHPSGGLSGLAVDSYDDSFSLNSRVIDSRLPLFTRILRIMLIGVGVVRRSSSGLTRLPRSKSRLDFGGSGSGRGREHQRDEEVGRAGASLDALSNSPSPSSVSSDGGGMHHFSRSYHLSMPPAGPVSSFRGPCTRYEAFMRWFENIKSYLYPMLVFLFILANVFFVTVSKNVDNQNTITTSTSRSYNNWISLASDFCMNLAPLLSWLGAFYMLGWSDERANLVFYEQLTNLEYYNKRILRNYLLGSCFAGLFLMATTNLTEINNFANDGATDGNNSFFTLINVGLFVLLNYLITTFVICALASLICIFHYYSLKIFQEQLYSQGLSVQEAIKEHIVLMRLLNESSKYVQNIIFPPLILYITGALLAAYNMLSTQVYSHLSTTAFQLILAFVTLMLPLVSGAQITSICADLARLATNLDLTNNLVERSSLIQQLVLLPGNCFQIFGIVVNYSLLAKLSYVILATIVVLARGASLSSSTKS